MKTNIANILLVEGPQFFGGIMALLLVLVLLTILGVCYLYINSKTKERLALIEKGMDPNLANSDFLTQIGIIAGCFAAGLIGGDKIPGGYGPLIGILLAAVALASYNIIKRNRAKKNNKL